MFIIDGKFTIIDYEWIYDFPIPLEYIFYRTFRYHFYSSASFREFTSFEEIFEHFNLDTENLKLFRSWECNFLRYFLNRPPLTHSKVISLENVEKIEQLEKYDQIQKKIELKNKEIERKDDEIKRLLNSNSWKMTEPLRKLKTMLKKD